VTCSCTIAASALDWSSEANAAQSVITVTAHARVAEPRDESSRHGVIHFAVGDHHAGSRLAARNETSSRDQISSMARQRNAQQSPRTAGWERVVGVAGRQHDPVDAVTMTGHEQLRQRATGVHPDDNEGGFLLSGALRDREPLLTAGRSVVELTRVARRSGW